MIPGAINGIQNFVSGRRGKQDESDSSAPVQTGETAPTAE